MSEGQKIVVTLRGGRYTVGVQDPGCDPVVSVVPGSLEEVLAQVPALVTRAAEQWQGSRQYPKTTRVTVPAPAPARTVTPARTPATPAKPVQAPKLF